MHFHDLINSVSRVCVVFADLGVTLLDTMRNNGETAALRTANGLRPLSLQVSRNFEILGSSPHQIYDVATQNHLLLSETVTEKLI